MAEDYLEIQNLANVENAEIFFIDDYSVRSDYRYHSGTTWGPPEKTPVVKTTASRHNVNLKSSISAR